ncbi:MAG: acyl-CoA/acyl-ACP dehydrogenase [Flavobacteriales bacterium]|nr:acyl-CoA/acyl-ACP dehydrogenase [Flavobacteriales bacterium]
MEPILEDLQYYCQTTLTDYLKEEENELSYPNSIIDDLSELGIFGLNIPKDFGGLGMGLPENVQTMSILGGYWLTLPALLGTHLRANMYLKECGTDDQKKRFLPDMARGKTIFSHAYHERATKNLSLISTTVESTENGHILNGSKDWVTNSYNSDKYIVIARNISNNNVPVAIIVDPTGQGVNREKELIRPGIKGVSLSSVSFNNVIVDSDMDIIGGRDFSVADFIAKYKLGSSISFSARAVGAAESVIEHVKDTIRIWDNRENGKDVIAFRFAQMYSKYLGAKTNLAHVVANFGTLEDKTATAYLTKVNCSNMLQDVIRDAIMLKGGHGYASEDCFLQRMYRDCASLPLIDTPNDILLYRSGLELLK